MSTGDFPQNEHRVGGWVPSSTVAGTAGGGGTIYRGGVPVTSQEWVEPVAGTSLDGSLRRTLLLVAGLAAAAALSLAGYLAASHAPQGARVVGTMGDPEPLLPSPPALTPLVGRTEVAVERPGVAPRTGDGDPTGASRAPSETPSGVVTAQPGVTGSVAPTPVAPSPAPAPSPTGAVPGDVTVALTTGTMVSLESMARPDHLVRHGSSRAVVVRVGLGSSPDERAAARFIVRAGLADRSCVSFESDDRPHRFLRHRNFAIHLHRADRGSLFAADATFCPVPAGDGRRVSFRSYNFPDRHLSVRGSLLFLDRAGGPAESMTFAVRPPV